MYNILLATEHPVIAKGILAIANETIPKELNIKIVGSFVQLETQLANSKPQQLVLDLQLIKLATIQFHDIAQLKLLVKRYPSVDIIILYNKIETTLFKWMYQIGIKGILGRNAPLKDFESCMLKVYKNEIYIEDKILVGFLNVPPQMLTTREATKYTRSTTLTKREKTIAKLLIEGKSNTQICTILQLQPSTVSTFKHHVFKKLQVSNLIELEQCNMIAV